MKKLYVLMLVTFIGLQAGNETSQVHPKNSIEKVKAFLGTKEGKLMVGAVCVSAGIGTVGLIYYVCHKRQKLDSDSQADSTSNNTQNQYSARIAETRKSLTDYLKQHNAHLHPEIPMRLGINGTTLSVILDVRRFGFSDEQKKALSRSVQNWGDHSSYSNVHFCFDDSTLEEIRNTQLELEISPLMPWTGGKTSYSVKESDKSIKITIETDNGDLCGDTVTDFQGKQFKENLSKWVTDKKKAGIQQISLSCYRKMNDNRQFLFTVAL